MKDNIDLGESFTRNNVIHKHKKKKKNRKILIKEN